MPEKTTNGLGDPNTGINKKGRRRASTPNARREIILYACMAIGCFCLGFLMVGVLVWNVDILAKLGLIGQFYYLALLPLGLFAALGLFGTLRSYGHYKGEFLGGTVEIGGALVGFVIVIVLGFQLPKPSSNFPVTVFVHGEAGMHETPLKGTGFVLMDLGSERRREPIGNKGQAVFSEIPASFRGQDVQMIVESDDFEMLNPDELQVLDSSSLYLAVRRKPGIITGRVQDADGTPLSGVRITLIGLSTTTAEDGYFEMIIPGSKMRKEFTVQAMAQGYQTWRSNTVTPGANELVVVMEPDNP